MDFCSDDAKSLDGDTRLDGDTLAGDGLNGDSLNDDGLDGEGLDGDGLNDEGLDGDGLDGEGLDGEGLDGDGLEGELLDRMEDLCAKYGDVHTMCLGTKGPDCVEGVTEIYMTEEQKNEILDEHNKLRRDVS